MTEEAFVPKIRILPDGSIGNAKIELYALILADDVPGPDAWRAAGYDVERQAGYRRKIHMTEEFQRRLAQLQEERNRLMAEDPYGRAEWMAGQLYRVAIAKGDVSGMTKAADMQLKISMAKGGASGAAAQPAADAGPPKPVGRPPTEMPNAREDMSDIKRRLRDMGVKTPDAAA